MHNVLDTSTCPCCGSGAEVIELTSGMSPDVLHTYYVQCRLCGLRTRTFSNKSDATNAWNTRVNQQDLSDVVATLRDENSRLWELYDKMHKDDKDDDESKQYVG